MRCAGHTPLWMVCGGRVFPRQDNCHNTKTLSRSIIIILRAGAGTFTTNAMGFESKPFPPRPSPFPFPHYPIEYSQRDHLAAVCRTAPPPSVVKGLSAAAVPIYQLSSMGHTGTTRTAAKAPGSTPRDHASKAGRASLEGVGVSWRLEFCYQSGGPAGKCSPPPCSLWVNRYCSSHH